MITFATTIKLTTDMKIGVFCSANSNIDADFFTATEQLGRWMAENGHTLVFGGTNQGLMQCIAGAVKRNGGHTIGVVPSLIEKYGRTSDYIDTTFMCASLSDRKDLLMEQSDICIALPGGVGTLDEVFTVMASHTIGYHHKHVIIYNIKGFWNKLISLLDDLKERGFIRGSWSDCITVADSLEDIAKLCSD